MTHDAKVFCMVFFTWGFLIAMRIGWSIGQKEKEFKMSTFKGLIYGMVISSTIWTLIIYIVF